MKDTAICKHLACVFTNASETKPGKVECVKCGEVWTDGVLSAQELLECARLDALENLGENE